MEILQVGNRVIQTHEITSLLTRYQLMPQFLRGIITDQAIAQVTCTQEERQNAVQSALNQLQITSQEALNTWLQSQGLTQAELEELAIRPLLLEKFKQVNWGTKVESYFLTRKTTLDQVVYSLIRTKDLGLSQEIFFRVQEGEQSFADLAREYSEGPEAHTGGLLGPVALSQPHPALAKLLSVSQPGQLWPPRTLGEWFVIVRLEKFIPAQLDDAMRRLLIDELFENWMREQLQNLGPLKSLWSSPQEEAVQK